MNRVVVSDTSPLRALAHLQLLKILSSFYDEVLIPPAVAAELAHAIDGVTLDLPSLGSLFRVVAPRAVDRARALAATIDQGEAEAIALALDMTIHDILMDEKRGREVAKRNGLRPIGVLGLLLRAKEKGLIDAVAPRVDALVTGIQFRVSASVLRELLVLAGEHAD